MYLSKTVFAICANPWTDQTTPEGAVLSGSLIANLKAFCNSKQFLPANSELWLWNIYRSHIYIIYIYIRATKYQQTL